MKEKDRKKVILRGMSACPGTVEGKVKIIPDYNCMAGFRTMVFLVVATSKNH